MSLPHKADNCEVCWIQAIIKRTHDFGDAMREIALEYERDSGISVARIAKVAEYCAFMGAMTIKGEGEDTKRKYVSLFMEDIGKAFAAVFKWKFEHESEFTPGVEK